MVKILDIEEITNIYNKYILNDFPASEVKSLRRILEGVQNGQYYACAYMEEDAIKAYAFFIQSMVNKVRLLDYFAVVSDKRSKGYGSKFLRKLVELAKQDDVHMILEIENPDLARPDQNRDYMIRRKGFYEKNDIKVSNVSCSFADNEYSILYAGNELGDEQIRAEIEGIYREFFGDEFIDKNCVFH